MKVYVKLLKYEFKTLLRDSMNLFMLIYPLFMLGFVGWLIPMILTRSGLGNDDPAYALSMVLVFLLVLSIGGFISGILLGFSLLENKDEQTIKAIAVSPISVQGYVLFKTIYAYFLGVIGTFVMIFGLQYFFEDAFSFQYQDIAFGLANLQLWQILLFSFVSSLMTPTAGALMAAVAKNKIEGFALTKSAGIIIMMPLLVILDAFGDWKQYLLGVVPNFWPVKALFNITFRLDHPDNLDFLVYNLIGIIYALVIASLSIRYFIKRVNAERSS
jgi:fluoroquinolone transport system permease protein